MTYSNLQTDLISTLETSSDSASQTPSTTQWNQVPQTEDHARTFLHEESARVFLYRSYQFRSSNPCEEQEKSYLNPKKSLRQSVPLKRAISETPLALTPNPIQVIKTSGYFKEAAAIELAVFLLTLHGEPMEDIKLMQLMYLVERGNILRRGHPITNDEYYATDSGVLMKNIWESLVGNSSDDAPLGNWAESLHCENGFVRTKVDYKPAELSRAIIKVATKVFDEFNQCTVNELSRWMTNPENLPEWQNPNGFPRPIKIATILRTDDCPEEDIALILEEIALDQSMTMRFSA